MKKQYIGPEGPEDRYWYWNEDLNGVCIEPFKRSSMVYHKEDYFMCRQEAEYHGLEWDRINWKHIADILLWRFPHIRKHAGVEDALKRLYGP